MNTARDDIGRCTNPTTNSQPHKLSYTSVLPRTDQPMATRIEL